MHTLTGELLILTSCPHDMSRVYLCEPISFAMIHICIHNVSWNSVYQGNYYYMTGVQVHELGHNFNLAHSGGLDGATYTDHTGMMGNPLYSDDTGKM